VWALLAVVGLSMFADLPLIDIRIGAQHRVVHLR
jgi:hypothetical protein